MELSRMLACSGSLSCGNSGYIRDYRSDTIREVKFEVRVAIRATPAKQHLY